MNYSEFSWCMDETDILLTYYHRSRPLKSDMIIVTMCTYCTCAMHKNPTNSYSHKSWLHYGLQSSIELAAFSSRLWQLYEDVRTYVHTSTKKKEKKEYCEHCVFRTYCKLIQVDLVSREAGLDYSWSIQYFPSWPKWCSRLSYLSQM